MGKITFSTPCVELRNNSVEMASFSFSVKGFLGGICALSVSETPISYAALFCFLRNNAPKHTRRENESSRQISLLAFNWKLKQFRLKHVRSDERGQIWKCAR